MTLRNEQFQKSRLGRLLVNRGYISEQQLDQALIEQGRSGQRLGEVLVTKGWVSQTDLARVLKDQSRYRKIATVVALATAPLQPMMAAASPIPTTLPINSVRAEVNQANTYGKLNGLQMLDDEAMSGVSAQGFAPGEIFGLAQSTAIAMAHNTDVASGMHNKYREDEEDKQPREEQIAHELNDTVLSSLGLGPISSLLDADMSIEGVKYMEGRAPVEVLGDGRIRFYMPTEIARISMENIRVKGETDGATMGSIYMSNISFAPGSNYTISTRRD